MKIHQLKDNSSSCICPKCKFYCFKERKKIVKLFFTLKRLNVEWDGDTIVETRMNAQIKPPYSNAIAEDESTTKYLNEQVFLFSFFYYLLTSFFIPKKFFFWVDRFMQTWRKLRENIKFQKKEKKGYFFSSFICSSMSSSTSIPLYERIKARQSLRNLISSTISSTFQAVVSSSCLVPSTKHKYLSLIPFHFLNK